MSKFETPSKPDFETRENLPISSVMKVAQLLMIPLVLAGCGKLEFSQTPLHMDPPVILPLGKTSGIEQVSGASPTGGAKTAGNYTVDASVGSLTDQQKVSTGGGYTVWSGFAGIKNSP